MTVVGSCLRPTPRGSVRRGGVGGAGGGLRLFKCGVDGGDQHLARGAGFLFRFEHGHLGVGELAAADVGHQAVG